MITYGPISRQALSALSLLFGVGFNMGKETHSLIAARGDSIWKYRHVK